MISSIIKRFYFLAIFGVARGALFAAPILLANFIPHDLYGLVEFSQAFGSLFAPLAVLGVVAVVPLVLIIKINNATMSAVLLHHILMSGAAIIGATVFWVLGEVTWAMCLCILSTLMLQSLWSTSLKSSGKPEASMFMDTGLWILLVVTGGFFSIFNFSVTSNILISGIGIYFTFLFLFTLNKLMVERKILKSSCKYKSTLRMGIPLMLIGLSSTVVTTSGRLGMGFLTTPDLTADYASLFRVSSIPMVAHQILTISGYGSFFKSDMLKIEMRLFRIVFFVFLIVMIVSAGWGFFEPILGGKFVSTRAERPGECFVILVQCLMWSAIALNDLVISRVQLGGKAAGFCLGYLVLSVPLAWFWLVYVGVTMWMFALVHSVLMAGYYLLQASVMLSANVRMYRKWGFVLTAFLLLNMFSLSKY